VLRVRLGKQRIRASFEGIIRAFERVSSPAAKDEPRQGGCLMVNTLFEIDEPAEAIVKEITLYRELFRHTFQEALEADNIQDAGARADFLVGVMWGALSQIRLAHDTTAAEPMTSITIETIRSWTKAT
jgi:hypothetical protein